MKAYQQEREKLRKLVLAEHEKLVAERVAHEEGPETPSRLQKRLQKNKRSSLDAVSLFEKLCLVCIFTSTRHESYFNIGTDASVDMRATTRIYFTCTPCFHNVFPFFCLCVQGIAP